ncbi:hypothetical protein PIB30_015305 [Stylosanthes scabra]|uniref:Uncharacterized protein n=1 Tax=Stylosanthes scabra TaxID=79078 RepID=A0ABU6Z3I6_9FABA|nr:hypothetical protein [Stylosanthes scabra]
MTTPATYTGFYFGRDGFVCYYFGRYCQSEKKDDGDYGGSDSSRSFALNLQNDDAGSGLDRIIGEVHSREVVAEHGRRMHTGLSELRKEIQKPLYFYESSGQCSILSGATTHCRLFGAFPGDQIRTKEDAISSS